MLAQPIRLRSVFHCVLPVHSKVPWLFSQVDVVASLGHHGLGMFVTRRSAHSTIRLRKHSRRSIALSNLASDPTKGEIATFKVLSFRSSRFAVFEISIFPILRFLFLSFGAADAPLNREQRRNFLQFGTLCLYRGEKHAHRSAGASKIRAGCAELAIRSSPVMEREPRCDRQFLPSRWRRKSL